MGPHWDGADDQCRPHDVEWQTTCTLIPKERHIEAPDPPGKPLETCTCVLEPVVLTKDSDHLSQLGKQEPHQKQIKANVYAAHPDCLGKHQSNEDPKGCRQTQQGLVPSEWGVCNKLPHS